MSVKIIEQSLTVRTEPGEFKETIERYKINGWTVDLEDTRGVLLTNPLIAGVQVTLIDEDTK